MSVFSNQAGEQYFLDLGGNIKKGPTSKSSSCYCGPAFQKFEKKLEKDKQVNGYFVHASFPGATEVFIIFLFVCILLNHFVLGSHHFHFKELLKHIDNSHSKLDNKISHLERKTRDQLFNLNQTMKESFASERFLTNFRQYLAQSTIFPKKFTHVSRCCNPNHISPPGLSVSSIYLDDPKFL